MQQLTLLGLNSDGQSLVLVDEQGSRYTLPIDDQLRSHIRKERVDLESIRGQAGETLRPRDIQAMLRAGATAEEVAEISGLEREHIARYQSPVLAERRWAVEQALATTLSHHFDAPTFGDLVVDRLATRSVDTRRLDWDATRAPAEPWIIHLSFVQNARQMEASWELDVASGTLTALDEQARWLTETTTGSQPPQSLQPLTGNTLGGHTPGIATVNSQAVQDEESNNGANPNEQTETLLAELAQARGTRLQVARVGDEDDVAQMEAAVRGETLPPAAEPHAQDGSYNQHTPTPPNGELSAVITLPTAQTSQPADNANSPTNTQASNTQQTQTPQEDADTGDATPSDPTPEGELALPGFENVTAAPQTQQGPTLKRKSRRRSVPSWDEILFGAKPE